MTNGEEVDGKEIHALLVGEGVNDVGRDVEGRRMHSYHVPGALEPLLSRLAEEHSASIRWDTATYGDVRRVLVTPSPGSNRNDNELFGRKMLARADDLGATHIALHRDEDNQGYEQKHEEAERMLRPARAKGLSCLSVVPVHMTESWLLCDSGAYERAFGRAPH